MSCTPRSPINICSRIASVQSLRANILVDLGKNDDAAGAAEEAVTILKEQGDTQPELVYAMLNYAVLLGSTGRGEGAAAVAFELMGYIDDSTIMQPDIILVSPLCQLCVSTACTEFDSDLALTEADKAIEASRASLDANSKVVLAGALLAKSKLLSSNGQNDVACSISTEAVTLFRRASVDRHVFSLLLANALFANSHQLSEANRKGESYTTIHEAVEIWQTVQISAPVASKRPLAWALFELAKYRQQRRRQAKTPQRTADRRDCRQHVPRCFASGLCWPGRCAIPIRRSHARTRQESLCGHLCRRVRSVLPRSEGGVTTQIRPRPHLLAVACVILSCLHGTERGCSRVCEASGQGPTRAKERGGSTIRQPPPQAADGRHIPVHGDGNAAGRDAVDARAATARRSRKR